MWKYIVIASLVLIAGGSYVFYKTHQALVSADGEVAALQAQYESAIAKNKEIFTDECIAAYARARGEWLVKCKAESEEQEAKFREEDLTYTTEIQRLEAELKSMGGKLSEFEKKREDLLNALVNDEALQKALSDLQESGGEVTEMDISDEDVLANLATNISMLKAKRDEFTGEIAKDESSIQTLQANKDSLLAAIKKERDIAHERQARLSPETLNCNVVLADPTWEYVIVDAGADAGVVIGSRLVVMRGERKICEMNVTLVEGNRSSCDIVMNTLLTGEAVKVGDRVVSLRPAQKD